MKKKIIIISAIILILLAIGIIWVYYYLPTMEYKEIITRYKDDLKKRTDFDFSYSRCFFLSGGKYFDPYIKYSKWQDNSTFYVKIAYPENCGYVFSLADYRVDGNKLFLMNEPVGDFMSCGYCRANLKYIIKNIAQKDYEIIIENPNSIYNFSTKQWSND